MKRSYPSADAGRSLIASIVGSEKNWKPLGSRSLDGEETHKKLNDDGLSRGEKA
jgi:hypothetical protein